MPLGTIPAYVSQFGSKGTGNGQFKNDTFDAIDGAGDIWVTDSENRRIEEFSPSGVFIRAAGSRGSGEGQFSYPLGIAVNKRAGDVYVVDEGNDRVDEFSASEGKFIRAWGIMGSGKGEFSAPEGVAVDSTGNVYVTDTLHSRVEVFTSSGVFIREFGTHGSGNGQFSSPRGIAVDPRTGNVYVADTDNNRIEILTPTGTFVAAFGSAGSGEGQFNFPQDVALDPRTDVAYVPDTFNHRVEAFSSTGRFIGQFGSEGEQAGQFAWPWGAAVDSTGDVFIVDFENDRVEKWGLPARLTGQSGWYSIEEEADGESAFAGVNVAGGNLLVENEDLPAEEATANVRLDRFYNSQSASTTGTLGPGWSWDSGPDVYLSDLGETVVLHGANGYAVTLQRQTNGTYTAPTEFSGTLTKNENGTYTLTGQEGVTDTFNTAGVMSGYTNEEAHSFTVTDTTLSGQSVLHSLAPSVGKALEVTYNGTPRVTTTTDPAGHLRHYEYNAQNQLASYTNPAGQKTEYGYDANGYLNKITTPNGTVETITTVAGKVTQVTITPKNEPAYSDKFEYVPPSGPTCNASRDAGETVVTHPPETGTPEVYCWEGLGEITAYSGPSEAEEDPSEIGAEEQSELPANTCYENPEFPPTDCGQEDPLPENEEAKGLALPLVENIPDLGPTHYGIADNNHVGGFNIFTNSQFHALHVVNVRRTVPWNTVYEANHNPGNTKAKEELADVKTWVKDVKALSNGTGQPTVSIDICSQGESWINPLKPTESISCKVAPNKQQYEIEIKEFLETETLKEIKYFTAWNEPNNKHIAGEPTAKEAGEYWRVLDGLCAPSKHNCLVAAGEFLDSEMPDANDAKSTGGKYLIEYYKAMGHPTTAYRWAWHAYSDGEATYNLRSTPEKWWKRFHNFHNAIDRLTKTTHKPDIWLTEQGVIYSRNGVKLPAGKNGNIAQGIMRAYVSDGSTQLTRQSRQITRYFYYQMRGTPLGPGNWDSGLLFPTGTPKARAIYNIYKTKTPPS